MYNFTREYTVPSWSMKPSICILIPVFNHAQYIEVSINSILEQVQNNQFWKNLKIKVLNDGSKEEILPHIKKFIELGQIEFIEQLNKGLPSALNELYKWEFKDENQVDYITWHSADNLYLPNSLNTMATFLTANPDLDYTFANVQLIDANGMELKESNYRKPDQSKENTSILNLDYPTELLSEFNDNFINACFLEKRLSCTLTQLFKPDCNGFEDYLHWLNMSFLGKGRHLNKVKPLYQYRLHNDSLTSTIVNETLANKQKIYFDKLIPHFIEAHNQEYGIKGKAVFHINSSNVLSSYHDEQSAHLHTTHSQHQRISAKVHLTEYGNRTIIPGSFEPPKVIQRARGRYLGLFEDEYEQTGRVIIFTPDDFNKFNGLKEAILEFISSHKDLGIVLFCGTKASRTNSDHLFLASNLAKNLRIVDSQECTNAEERAIILLNALGSCDAIISISAFIRNLTTILKEETYLYNDFCAEAALAAGAGRALLCPSIVPQSISGPLPHVLSWDSTSFLPTNIKSLKTELTNAHFDSILRLFSSDNIKKKQIGSIIPIFR